MYIYIIVLFATLRTLFIYLPFSVRCGNKCLFSIVQKSFDSLVPHTYFIHYVVS